MHLVDGGEDDWETEDSNLNTIGDHKCCSSGKNVLFSRGTERITDNYNKKSSMEFYSIRFNVLIIILPG